MKGLGQSWEVSRINGEKNGLMSTYNVSTQDLYTNPPPPTIIY